MKAVRKQVLRNVLDGTADANIRFDDLRSIMIALGFIERVKGSHQIFAKEGIIGDPQSSTTRLAGEAIPSEAGPCCDCSL